MESFRKIKMQQNDVERPQNNELVIFSPNHCGGKPKNFSKKVPNIRSDPPVRSHPI